MHWQFSTLLKYLNALFLLSWIPIIAFVFVPSVHAESSMHLVFRDIERFQASSHVARLHDAETGVSTAPQQTTSFRWLVILIGTTTTCFITLIGFLLSPKQRPIDDEDP